MSWHSNPLISVIGSLNIDFVTTTSRVPGPGETITATALQVNAGGKGANQAVACGKASFTSETEQDVDVEMVGAVGANDPYYASLLRPTLEKSGVSTRAVREVKGSQTGTATILVEETGENRILVVPGANHESMQDTKTLRKLATEERMPDVLVMQGEIPRRTVLDLVDAFSGEATKIVFNPAPVFPDGIPSSILAKVEYLVVNETECLLLGKSVSKTAASITSEEDLTTKALEDITLQLRTAVGIKNIVVTLGAKGVFYRTEYHTGVIPGVKVAKVVDTTAAGDTFVGYLAAALARHVAKKGADEPFDLEAAIAKANAAAGICVQYPGAMQSIPFDYQVQTSTSQ